MIIPMTKYTFLVFHAEYSSFLNDLHNAGLLHIEEKNKELSSEVLSKYEEIKTVKNQIKFLEKIKTENKKQENKSDISANEILIKLSENKKQQEDFEAKKAGLKKEIDKNNIWGDFSYKEINFLKEKGIKIRLFACAEKVFHQIENSNFFVEIIEKNGGKIYFAAIEKDKKIEIDAEEFPIPQKTISQLESELKDVEKCLSEIVKENKMLKQHIPILKKHLYELTNLIDYEKVICNTKSEAKEKIKVLEGWLPKNSENNFEKNIAKNDLFFIKQKATEKDKPPILLRNNFFSRLFEPIGKLFSLPSYGELDLTPFFAPFFMLFFGFCLGDAGYGIFMLLAASIYKLKAKKSAKPFLTLAQFLGSATILFGALSGTVFGVNLIETKIETLSNIRNLFLSSDQMFNLALVIGFFQIMFGLIIQAANKIKANGILYGIQPLGWILLLISLLDKYLLKQAGDISQYSIYLSLFLIVFFSSPKGSILSRLGKGLWDLYGITGFFGDILSYIRLFALGISSSILGFVINDIAIRFYDAIPVVGVVLFIVFLVIGHAANLMISSLGSFVHPMRLTFVEFYKNAGFTGGGKEYKPFKKKH